MTTEELQTHVNSATLVMGISGSGKTSLLATYALWIWMNWRKVTLLVSVDGGGFPALVEELRDKGIIRVWRARTRGGEVGELAFETCQRASQGWWPSEIDPKTGETKPSVRLVPPLTTKYQQYCENGHLQKTVPFQKLLTPVLCPKCKSQVTQMSQRIETQVERTRGFEDVGGMAFDGITSMCSWGMMDLAHRVGTRELKGEEGSLGGKLVSGDMSWGANNRSHYGFTQQRAEEFVTNSLSIPGLVAPPLFTALTLETTERGGLPIVGPALAGQAKTGDAPQWFGNCFEATKVLDDKNKEHFRLYLAEWIDDMNRRHLCKHRGGPVGVPKYLDDPAEGEGSPFSIFNLGHAFELLRKSREGALAGFADQLGDVPGVDQAPASYGEPVRVEEGAAAKSAAPPAAKSVKAATPRVRARKPAAKPAPAPPASEPVPDAPAATAAMETAAEPVAPSPPPPPETPPETKPVDAAPAAPAKPTPPKPKAAPKPRPRAAAAKPARVAPPPAKPPAAAPRRPAAS